MNTSRGVGVVVGFGVAVAVGWVAPVGADPEGPTPDGISTCWRNAA